MTVLLDTCAWLFWQQEPGRLTFDADDAIREALTSGKIYVSAASVWEIAVKSAKGRLELGAPVEDWITTAGAQVDILDLDPGVLMASCSLPAWDHQDPFDRIIVAEARRLEVPLVTSDHVIRAWSEVRTIW